MTTSTQPLLFSRLPTRYGPTARLGRALLALEEALRLRGVFLSLDSMDTLLDINKREAEGWKPLVAIFDPTFNDLDDSNAFALVGRDREGRVVATQAARLFDWRDSDFKTEAQSLRLFYQTPDRHALPGERCEVTAIVASAISGRFVFSGAAWNRPEYRRSGLVQLLPRISRAYALTKWNPDLVATMMARPLVERGVAARVGYGNLEWGVTLRNSRMGDVDFSLQWIKAAEIVPDLDRVITALQAQRCLGELEILHHRDQ